MFNSRYWNPRYWCERYWPKVGATEVVPDVENPVEVHRAALRQFTFYADDRSQVFRPERLPTFEALDRSRTFRSKIKKDFN